MSTKNHAKILAKIGKKSYNELNALITDLEDYLKETSPNWAISQHDLLDNLIQIFLYMMYKRYISQIQSKLYDIIDKNNSFLQKFSHNMFPEKPIPPMILELLITPVIQEISEWDFPLQKEIDKFFEFYGIFLRYYRPNYVKNSGIVHTPQKIVDYIIDGIDTLIEQRFKVEKGLRNPDFPFQIIDPASGTMNFYCQLFRFITPNKALEKDLSQKFLAIELNSLSFNLGLVEIQSIVGLISGQHNFHIRNSLTEESYNLMSDFLRTIHPTLSILFGNPPYYINTQNSFPWIQSQLKEFKIELKEKNLKILSDDYVKFFRISHKLFQEKNRIGIVAYITNNNYLDGPVFKSMRKSLVNTFNEIFIVNLHGNLRKEETGNPFNIKVGVSIIFLIKTEPNYNPDPDHTLSYLDYGNNLQIHYLDINSPDLATKYQKLSRGFNIDEFEKIEMTPDYFFIPRNYEIEHRYHNFIPINKMFVIKPKSGIMTGRDSLVSNPDNAVLRENMTLFFHKQFDQLKKLNVTVRKTKTWDPVVALNRTSKSKAQNSIIRYFYRGFIQDYVVYDRYLVDGCRMGYLDTISPTNPAICVTRSIRTTHYSHAIIVDSPPEKCLLGIKDSSYVFPLLQPQDLQQFNLNLTELDFDLNPKTLFYYIYAILYSPTYRTRYVEQLKRHFPRIPFPKDSIKLVYEMSSLGKKLTEYHLGQVKLSTKEFEIDNPTNLAIKDYDFDEISNKIYFDKQDNALSISNITQNMWDFDIGGIKQLHYWLRSRRFINSSENKKKRHIGLLRPITIDELNEFLELCAKICFTIDILPKLDKIFLQIDVL